MSELIVVGDEVEANRALPKKDVKKGDRGIVVGMNCIDSEDYLDIKLSNDKYVYCSCENCWNKVKS